MLEVALGLSPTTSPTMAAGKPDVLDKIAGVCAAVAVASASVGAAGGGPSGGPWGTPGGPTGGQRAGCGVACGWGLPVLEVAPASAAMPAAASLGVLPKTVVACASVELAAVAFGAAGGGPADGPRAGLGVGCG